MEMQDKMRLVQELVPGKQYTEEIIQHYINGDPGYIDTDWYDAIMKDYAFNMTHNVSLRGGSQQTQYYLSGNFTEDNIISFDK